jgi:hypothetical protein
LSVTVTKPTECANCGTEFEPASTGRPRETCGDRCRTALWRRRNVKRHYVESSIQDLRRAFYSASAEEQRAKRDEIARRLQERDLELERELDRRLAESEVAA